MNKTYTTISEFIAIVAERCMGEKNEADIKGISEQLRIIRTLLNKAGVDIYKIIGATPKEVFKRKTSKKAVKSGYFLPSNN